VAGRAASDTRGRSSESRWRPQYDLDGETGPVTLCVPDRSLHRKTKQHTPNKTMAGGDFTARKPGSRRPRSKTLSTRPRTGAGCAHPAFQAEPLGEATGQWGGTRGTKPIACSEPPLTYTLEKPGVERGLAAKAPGTQSRSGKTTYKTKDIGHCPFATRTAGEYPIEHASEDPNEHQLNSPLPSIRCRTNRFIVCR
jgi:hypothetical protein